MPVQRREPRLRVNTSLLCPPAGPPASAERASLPGRKAVSLLGPPRTLLSPQPPRLARQTRLDCSVSASRKHGRGAFPPRPLWPFSKPPVGRPPWARGAGHPDHLPLGWQAPLRVGAAPPAPAAPHQRSARPSVRSAGSGRDTGLAAGTGPCSGRGARAPDAAFDTQRPPCSLLSARPCLPRDRTDKGRRVLMFPVLSSERVGARTAGGGGHSSRAGFAQVARGTRGLRGCARWDRVFGRGAEWQLSPSPAGGLCQPGQLGQVQGNPVSACWFRVHASTVRVSGGRRTVTSRDPESAKRVWLRLGFPSTPLPQQKQGVGPWAGGWHQGAPSGRGSGGRGLPTLLLPPPPP